MTFKKLFYAVNSICAMMLAFSCFSQGISHSNYSIESKTATDSFSFCSLNFKVPQDCNQQEKTGSHSYVNEILKDVPMSRKEILSCSDGSLFWNYLKDEAIIEAHIEKLMLQLQRQMIKFKKAPVSCSIVNREATGFKLSMQPENGPAIHEIIAYGYVNGQYVLLEFASLKELKSSNTLNESIGQILQF